jgi:hypothetical protein
MAEFMDAVVARHGRLIAGYGAPTKATLLMKMAGIQSSDIAFVVEDNELKVGRFLPGTAIPIQKTSQLSISRPEVLVLFAWNFADDIIAKLKQSGLGPVEVVVPLPKLKVANL